MSTTGTIHIAGNDVQVGQHLRQRCAWCGEVLIDYDLARIAVPVGQDPRPSTWPPGELVLVDGPMSHTVDHRDGDQLPDNACAVLPVELTGKRPGPSGANA